MKFNTIGGLVVSALLIAAPLSIASAADMPLKAPPPPPASVYNWTGFYVGGNAGASWAESRSSLSIADGSPGYFNPLAIAGVNASGTFSNTRAGFTGGGQIGYNAQAGNAVFGVELDFNGLKSNASQGGTFLYTTNPTPYNLSSSMSADWLMTARGRLGYAMDRSLLYITGGVALTNLKFSQSFMDNCVGCVTSFSSSTTQAGWTIGGGYEYAITGNWSVKAEYLFARFNNHDFVGLLNVNSPGPVSATFNNNAVLNLNIARVGLNYKFGGPVVAKY